MGLEFIKIINNKTGFQFGMNSFHYHVDEESDNETVTQTETIQQPIVTLEYLLNQNKMKEIALSKATHLIELYKIELQVKQQDYLRQFELLKQTQRQNYEEVITELQEKVHRFQKHLNSQKQTYEDIVSQLEEKIIKLQKQLRSQQLKIQEYEKKNRDNQLDRLNQSACRIPKMSRNNSGRDLSINRKGRSSYAKNLSSTQTNNMKRSISTYISTEGFRDQDLYRIEKTFLIQYLLTNQQKDEKIITLLENQLSSQSQPITEVKGAIKGNEKFMEQFFKLLKEPNNQMENKLKDYKEVIKIQQLIIEQLNGQLFEYQNLFNVMNGALDQIFEKQNDDFYLEETRFNVNSSVTSFNRDEQNFEDFRDIIDQTQTTAINKIKQHKSFIKQKVTNMEAENKELKRIMDDMIKLIKNNKKIQALSFGNIRNPRTSQDLQYSKEKTKSQTIYRK